MIFTQQFNAVLFISFLSSKTCKWDFPTLALWHEVIISQTVKALIMWTRLSLNIFATVGRIYMGFSSFDLDSNNMGIIAMIQWRKPCKDRMYSLREICLEVSSQNKCLHCSVVILTFKNDHVTSWANRHSGKNLEPNF